MKLDIVINCATIECNKIVHPVVPHGLFAEIRNVRCLFLLFQPFVFMHQTNTMRNTLHYIANKLQIKCISNIAFPIFLLEQKLCAVIISIFDNKSDPSSNNMMLLHIYICSIVDKIMEKLMQNSYQHRLRTKVSLVLSTSPRVTASSHPSVPDEMSDIFASKSFY